jgi:hypothetical protein
MMSKRKKRKKWGTVLVRLVANGHTTVAINVYIDLVHVDICSLHSLCLSHIVVSDTVSQYLEVTTLADNGWGKGKHAR